MLDVFANTLGRVRSRAFSGGKFCAKNGRSEDGRFPKTRESGWRRCGERKWVSVLLIDRWIRDGCLGYRIR